MDLNEIGSKNIIITLPFTDLMCTEVIAGRQHILELDEERQLLHWVYRAKVNYREEIGSPWEERILLYDYKIKTSVVSSVELARLTFTDDKDLILYKVSVCTTSSNSELSIYFPVTELDQASKLQDEIEKFIFPIIQK